MAQCNNISVSVQKPIQNVRSFFMITLVGCDSTNSRLMDVTCMLLRKNLVPVSVRNQSLFRALKLYGAQLTGQLIITAKCSHRRPRDTGCEGEALELVLALIKSIVLIGSETNINTREETHGK